MKIPIIGTGYVGLAFKPNTDDIRESKTLPIIQELIKEKAKVRAYDPEVAENFKKIQPNIEYCQSSKEVIKDADAVLVTMLWDEFKNLDYSDKIVIDGRRIPEAKKNS